MRDWVSRISFRKRADLRGANTLKSIRTLPSMESLTISPRIPDPNQPQAATSQDGTVLLRVPREVLGGGVAFFRLTVSGT